MRDFQPQQPGMTQQIGYSMWAAIVIVLLFPAVLIGCRETQFTNPDSNVKVVPTITATPVRTATATVEPTQVPTSTRTPTLFPTATPTTHPTLIPMLVLPATSEAATAANANDGRQGRTATHLPDTALNTSFVGEFLNVAENRESQILLETRGDAVYVSLQTIRSPVQYLARQQPEVLVTVPEGFRPAIPVIWDVNGQHVGPDGQLDSSRRDLQVFRLRVDTDGNVRYVDDPGVNGVGYLRFHTTLAWPLAGTEPRVCERSPAIRERILAVLAELGEGALLCHQVGWDHLASIRTWSALEQALGHQTVWAPSQSLAAQSIVDLSPEHTIVQSHDLVGLTYLTELHVMVNSGSSLTPDLLAHTPHLRSLEVAHKSGILQSGSAVFNQKLLAYSPFLQFLAFSSFDENLQSELRASDFGQPPSNASIHLRLQNPNVSVLELPLWALQTSHLAIHGVDDSLPVNLLSGLPNLSYFAVVGEFNPCEFAALNLPTTVNWVDVELVVNDSQLACLADSWFAQHPASTSLDVQVHGLENSEMAAVPIMPGLTRMSLDLGNVLGFPPGFLAKFPNLTHLHLQSSADGLYADHPLDLPADLLKDSVRLIDLSLHFPSRLRHLPADLLVPVSNLQRFHLIGPNLTSLPSGFLYNQTQLTDVVIELCELDNLPTDFLTHTPNLRTIYIVTDFYACYRGLSRPGPTELPDRFLSHTPELTHLWLGLGGLEILPPSFLSHVPRLQHLSLPYNHGKHGKFTFALASLPEGFLGNAPSLSYLNLWPVVNLQSLPADFLAQSTRLQHLQLDINDVATLPDGFLVQVPELKFLELNAPNVTALPQGFLDHTPWLSEVKVDVNNVDVLPEGYLAHTPRLTHLDMRAKNVTRLPEGFLAHSSRIETLGLGLPSLTSPLKPGDALWDTLHSKGNHVTVTMVRTVLSRWDVPFSA